MDSPHQQTEATRNLSSNLMHMEFFDFFHLIFPKAMY
jgi:hypothetical protein